MQGKYISKAFADTMRQVAAMPSTIEVVDARMDIEAKVKMFAELESEDEESLISIIQSLHTHSEPDPITIITGQSNGFARFVDSLASVQAMSVLIVSWLDSHPDFIPRTSGGEGE